jgi:hypothetical protein
VSKVEDELKTINRKLDAIDDRRNADERARSIKDWSERLTLPYHESGSITLHRWSDYTPEERFKQNRNGILYFLVIASICYFLGMGFFFALFIGLAFILLILAGYCYQEMRQESKPEPVSRPYQQKLNDFSPRHVSEMTQRISKEEIKVKKWYQFWK